MNVVTVVLFVAGSVLIYAGLSDKSPRTILTDSLKQSAAAPAPTKGTKQPPQAGQNHGQANV